MKKVKVLSVLLACILTVSLMFTGCQENTSTNESSNMNQTNNASISI